MLRSLSFSHAMVATALLAALLLTLFPIAPHPTAFSYAASVVVITLVLWSTGVLPPFLTGLLFFALVSVFGLLPPEQLFAGFGSTAVWMVISGFVIGSAITSSKLGDRLAAVLSPLLTASYPKLIGGLVFTAMALGFVMPSSGGRAVVLIPIGLALAERVGFEPGSAGRLGVATALAAACNMPSFAVLPSNLPNMILAGSSESLYGIHIGYAEYLLLHFPILGMLKSILIVVLVLVVFPARIAPQCQLPIETIKTTSAATQQKKVAVVMGITLLLWVTDTLHGANPAWVGLVAAVVLMMPKAGAVDPKSFNTVVDFGTVIFVAAALGLGTLVNVSGIGSAVGQGFTQLMETDNGGSFGDFISLSLMATLTGVVATTPSVPTVLSPMAAELAGASGLSLPAVLMTQVVGFSTVIFPYQVAPLIMAMQLSKEPLSQLLKIIIPLALITIFLLMPLDYLWWRLLGWVN
ncbi:SLC13 family permease [Halomonas sp. ATBC28]|jgi:di/tricarboxylate transporter|uniref:Sodium-dependent dicarboxylate transporter SdcS n=1 Tax=Vreelandella titanicae TaxID=664683 RepID=A0A6N0YY18_9GAMM|nr:MULTISPECIES: SLC13 family permease [Halomonas]NVE90513.1 anion permease [Halomonas titanicae]PKH60794.1 sodium:sulfate symporter [Halomonas sp. Choline-3u-9]QKS24474.1 Sodium-dependent dicarboxylate transporter SdcS [Halomonas titanicae]TMU17656.1 SLC13 family permease [Halomonas sp. ATBC28]CDG54271.1 Sodium/sulphate symporter [Halomonas sp. A3H3]|tara:strand:- start:4039 stop:5433 length:1395 start_codon:yes stop_codon:yes gene_type:complete